MPLHVCATGWVDPDMVLAARVLSAAEGHQTGRILGWERLAQPLKQRRQTISKEEPAGPTLPFLRQPCTVNPNSASLPWGTLTMSSCPREPHFCGHQAQCLLSPHPSPHLP